MCFNVLMRLETKQKLQQWRNKIGDDEVAVRLKKRGVGLSTIDQMLRDDYDHEPKGANRLAIAEEMAADGITLDGKAS